MSNDVICLALTGASGSVYGLRLLECLLIAGCQVQLIYSAAARIVIQQETNQTLFESVGDAQTFFNDRWKDLPGSVEVFALDDWFAPSASGSAQTKAMVICPCSMGTLAAIAQGLSDNLIERAADVMLKEKRPLILVPRETPFSVIHLENMLRLARAGGIILPASPGFYTGPKEVMDLVDFVVARILDQLKINHQLSLRWGSSEG